MEYIPSMTKRLHLFGSWFCLFKYTSSIFVLYFLHRKSVRNNKTPPSHCAGQVNSLMSTKGANRTMKLKRSLGKQRNTVIKNCQNSSRTMCTEITMQNFVHIISMNQTIILSFFDATALGSCQRILKD